MRNFGPFLVASLTTLAITFAAFARATAAWLFDRVPQFAEARPSVRRPVHESAVIGSFIEVARALVQSLRHEAGVSRRAAPRGV